MSVKHSLWKLLDKYYGQALGAVGLALLGYMGMIILFRSYLTSIRFDGFFANGAFQLFNPLRRIADGQIPGHDFQFFHGLGTAYIHYPLYVVFGQNLYASEMARQLMSPALFAISTFFFLLIITRRWQVAVFLTGALIVIGNTMLTGILYPGNSLLGVRTTMPLIIAGVLILLLRAKDGKLWLSTFPAYNLVIGSLLAIAFFISLEQGLYALVTYLLIDLLFTAEKTGIVNRIRSPLITLLVFACGVLAIFGILSGPHLLEPIIYGLAQVPEDQFWYFGVPPNNFMDSLDDVFHDQLMVVGNLLLLATLAILVIFYREKKAPELVGLLYLGTYSLFLNISMLGIFHDNYLTPMVRINAITIIALAVLMPKLLERNIQSLRVDSRGIRLAYALMALVIILVSLAILPNIFTEFNKINDINIVNNVDQRMESGTYLSDSWKHHVDTFEAVKDVHSITTYDISGSWLGEYYTGSISSTDPAFVAYNIQENSVHIKNGSIAIFNKSGKRVITDVTSEGVLLKVTVDGPPLDPEGDGYPNEIIVTDTENYDKGDLLLWSFYSSILEDKYNIYNPASDYIIHSLGRDGRAQYLEQFRESSPRYVRTDNKEVWAWGEWIVNEHWDIYSLIVRNYEFVYSDKNGAVWKQTASQGQLVETQEWEGSIASPEPGADIVIPAESRASHSRIMVVNVSYEIDNPWQPIPIFGKLPRFLIYQNNTGSTCPVSLPPYRDSISFPLYLQDGTNPVLHVAVQPSYPGTSIHIKEIKYGYLNVSEANEQYLLSVYLHWKPGEEQV